MARKPTKIATAEKRPDTVLIFRFIIKKFLLVSFFRITSDADSTFALKVYPEPFTRNAEHAGNGTPKISPDPLRKYEWAVTIEPRGLAIKT